jgi:hypothetical protein
LGAYMMFDNKRRNSKYGTLRVQDVPTEKLQDGPAAPEFRWFY